jgi:GxxExxY protein
MGELILKDETYRILGACFEVYKTIGCGFLEEVYQECLEIEFALRDVPFVDKKQLDISYKGRVLRKKYIPDFLCYESVVVEIKAVSALVDEHKAQLLNYLHATKRPVGLLINFGHHPQVEYVRYVV